VPEVETVVGPAVSCEDLVKVFRSATGETHALRGFDAVHLASAAWLAKQVRKPIRMLAFDNHLNKAALALKMIVA
jgi:hypothetical protein